jgi:hypothetical protein
VETYRPRRPEAPESQCHHLVDPLEALKTLRLRAVSAKECRVNRGQHRAARAVGARVARVLLAEVAALPRLGAGS